MNFEGDGWDSRDIEYRDNKIKKLRKAVEMALDLEENILIDFKKYGLKSDADIAKKYREALE